MLIVDRFDFRTLSFEIHNLGSNSFFDYWRNNLDPYRNRSNEGKRVVRVCRGEEAGVLLDEWNPVATLGSGMFQMRVFRNPSGDTRWDYVFFARNEVFVSFWLSKDYQEIQLLRDNSHTAWYQPFMCLGQLIPSVMLKHDAIAFHGVLMEHEGRGIVLSAPSGTGKTTHARLWRDYRRALILNGDRATCCFENGRWIGFSLPWSGTSGECINRDVPLTAFVILEQALENSVERLTGLEAFGVVMPNLLYPSWDRELTEKALDFIDDFLEKVPVFRLRCRPDVDAVETLDRALREL